MFPMLPIAKEGLNLIVLILIITLIFNLLGLNVLTTIFFVIFLFLLFFFRDPEREVDLPQNIIISPADGKILSIEEIEEKNYINDKAFKISIFLSIFNVHITRIPLDGRIEKIDYKRGKFATAFSKEASSENENNTVFIKNEKIKLIVKQIAGLIARRIVCNRAIWEYMQRGQKLGIIKFGSRVELFIPQNVSLKIQVGQKVKGGKTIIGELIN